MAYHMSNATLAGDFHGTVGGTIIYNQRFQHIHTGYGPRHVAHNERQRALLVKARYLHNHFHQIRSSYMPAFYSLPTRRSSGPGARGQGSGIRGQGLPADLTPDP